MTGSGFGLFEFEWGVRVPASGRGWTRRGGEGWWLIVDYL